MAQVALNNGITLNFINTALVELPTPAGVSGERQVLFLSFVGDGTAIFGFPTLSGWTLEDTGVVDLGPNKLAVYTRALTSNVSQSTVTAEFFGNTSGYSASYTMDGLFPGTIQVVSDSSFGATKTLAAKTFGSADSLHVVALISGKYPRRFGALSGHLKLDEFHNFHGDGGYCLGVYYEYATQAESTGTVQFNFLNPENTTQDVLEGDEGMWVSFVMEPTSVSSDGLFTVSGKLPSIGVVADDETAQVDISDTRVFTATSQGTVQGLTWTKDSGVGTISTAGSFVSDEGGTAIIRVSSDEDNGVFDLVNVTVVPGAPIINPITDTTLPITVTGSGVPGSILEIFLNGVSNSQQTVPVNGLWTNNIEVSNGVYTLTANQTLGGVTSVLSAGAVFTVANGDAPVTVQPNLLPRTRTWFRTNHSHTKVKGGGVH
ncbi:hypothetical protein [uncultured Paraglaciecola sp.]|uniref:hypothetical protein n=1 Tax=uncultured Paraglaciecola sp. TaxID=1765024 RepID=UPI0026193CD0|nr:hypothetical protein [uncultured Paraglaciecola sp.]